MNEHTLLNNVMTLLCKQKKQITNKAFRITRAMNGKIQLLVTNWPNEFEKPLVQIARL